MLVVFILPLYRCIFNFGSLTIAILSTLIMVPADPVNLGFKAKLISVISCFAAIIVTALITQQFTLNSAQQPILVASMGASAVILFIIPNSPLAQPWPLLGGQLVSALMGIACSQVTSDTVLGSAYAVSGSVFAMLMLRCLHPPGAATALVPFVNHSKHLSYDFVLMPLGVNTVIMLVMAIIINRWLLAKEYPSNNITLNKNVSSPSSLIPQFSDEISAQEIDQALHDMNTFLDVSSNDIGKLLGKIHQQKHVQNYGFITCADIMVSDVITVEYGTEVEEACRLMFAKNLKALPVIDKAKRVIGIITLSDFFKFMTFNSKKSLQENFRAFISRTPDVSTNKPESVGHVMTAHVTTMSDSAHITELIPLMTGQGNNRQIPIINQEKRLVGIIYQSDLIKAIYYGRKNLPTSH